MAPASRGRVKPRRRDLPAAAHHTSQELHIVDIKNSNYTDSCPGEGQAARDFLCLYDTVANGVDDGYGYSESCWTKVNGKSIGAILNWNMHDNDQPYVGGTWTVKAP